MSTFVVSYARTNGYEGEGTVNHWADRGGETYAGISRKFHPDWAGWRYLDLLAQDGRRPALQEQHEIDLLHADFFMRKFWIAAGCHHIDDQDIADEMYDSAVNVGTGRAQEWLQVALNVCNRRGTLWPDLTVDGRVGPLTAKAAAQAVNDRLRKWLVLQMQETQQRHHYMNLAMADPTQEENIFGWFRLRVQHSSPPPSTR